MVTVAMDKCKRCPVGCMDDEPCTWDEPEQEPAEADWYDVEADDWLTYGDWQRDFQREGEQ